VATKTVRVSDLTGTEIPETEGTRLIVEHPDFPEPIGLDVLPQEVQDYVRDENTRFVVLSIENPENPNPQRFVLPFEEFERLFQSGDSQTVLADAYTAQQQEREAQTARRGRGRRRAAASGRQSRRQRIDYTTPEHAGEPHRGTISEAEKDYVRTNLRDVNKRRREQGHPEIDPSNPRDAAKYGFESPVNGGPSDVDTSTESREEE
jgi:hypothetical protein